MTGRGRFENRTLELASISRSLKGLAKELNVPIVVLSQLSRAPESRSDHRPQLSDLRECVTGDTLVCLTDGRRVPIAFARRADARRSGRYRPDGRLVEAHVRQGVAGRRSRRVADPAGQWADDRRPRPSIGCSAAAAGRRVGALAVGDRLALARRVPEPADARPLAGPSRGAPRPPGWRRQLSHASAAALHHQLRREQRHRSAGAEDEFGCRVTRHEAPTGSWHQLVISGNGNRWRPAGVNAWLRELGIFGQRSFQKRMPSAAFQLAERSGGACCSGTSGRLTGRSRRARPSRGSHSVVLRDHAARGLPRDVAALLLRLGIVARIGSRVEGGLPSVVPRPGLRVDAQRTFLERRRCLRSAAPSGATR